MKKQHITINTTITATQWNGETENLPDHFHLCRPEVCFSADRQLVYFTYADLQPRHWIDVQERELSDQKLDFMCGGIKTKRNDGKEYWRQYYPFAVWSVKSEASATNNYRPVYLDPRDQDLVNIFLDFCYLEHWSNPLPPRAEHRIIDGAYGRGYRTHYLSPTDWLVEEQDKEPRVMTNNDFIKLSS